MQKNVVARNAGLFYLSQVWEGFTAIAILAILFRYLGITLYGEYATVFALVSFIVPMTFMGIQQVGIREIARLETDREKGEYLGSLLQARFILLGFAGLFIILALFLDHVTGEPLNDHILYGTFLFFLSVFIGSSGELFVASFWAGERFQYQLYVTLAESTLLFSLIAATAFFDLGFFAVFVCYILSKLMKTVLALRLQTRYFFNIIFHFNLKWIMEIVRESFVIGIGISSGLGFQHAIVLVLKQIAGVEVVAIFSAYYRIVLRLQMLSVGVSRSLMPRISRAAVDRPVVFSRLVRKGIIFLFCLGLLCVLCLWPLKELLVRILFGAEAMSDVRVLGTLLLILPFVFSDNLLNVATISKKMGKMFMSAKLSGLFLGIAVTALLTRSLGIYGAVAGTFSGKLLTTFILLIGLRKYLFVKGRPKNHANGGLPQQNNS